MKNILLATLSMAFVSLVSCSDHKANMPTDFRAVEYTPIKGASRLGQPFFLRDNQGNPIFVEKSGVAYPMLFDYNGDGKENLLVGDFGMAKNANLLAFDNLGTKKKPLFSSEGNYMVDVNSDKLAIHGH